MTVFRPLALLMALSLSMPFLGVGVVQAASLPGAPMQTPVPIHPLSDKTGISGIAQSLVPDSVPLLIGEPQITTTQYEDTLVHLARRYNVGFVEIRAANPGVDPWIPGAGTKITLPTQHILPNAPHKGVVINLSEMRLYVFGHDGDAPATYPIGIGRSGLTTPLGSTTVARATIDPIWTPTPRMRKEDPTLPAVVPPGPENPMGTHALYLGWESYAIHGTDKPYSIGRRLSSGCIRMYPEDILTLYDNIPVGTSVTVVDQPIKTAWIGNDFYIEAHPTQEQADILSHDYAYKPSYPVTEEDIRTVLAAAGDAASTLDFEKIRKVLKERRGLPTIVGKRDHLTENLSQKNQEMVVPSGAVPQSK